MISEGFSDVILQEYKKKCYFKWSYCFTVLLFKCCNVPFV